MNSLIKNDFNALFWEVIRAKIEPQLIKEGWVWEEYARATPEVRKIMLKELK